MVLIIGFPPTRGFVGFTHFSVKGTLSDFGGTSYNSALCTCMLKCVDILHVK